MPAPRKVIRPLLAVVLGASTLIAAAPPSRGDTADDGWSRSFYWGVASSGYQAEGHAPDSNWRRYIDKAAGKEEGVEPYKNSVNFRKHYADDIKRAKALGINTFRLGIEWARVQPRPGVWDEKELAFYDDVIKKVKAAGMTPMITLHHFTEPGWITDQGSWAGDQTVPQFVTYVERITQRYRNQGVLWVTINEPGVLQTHNQRVGSTQWWQYFSVQSNLVKAHRQAYDAIHRIDPGAKVTSNQAYISGFNDLTDLTFLNQIKDKLDFIGIDYYYGLSLDNWSAISAASGSFWEVKLQPEGIYYALRNYHRRFPNLPLYIVENGMPTDNGSLREADSARLLLTRRHRLQLPRPGKGERVAGRASLSEVPPVLRLSAYLVAPAGDVVGGFIEDGHRVTVSRESRQCRHRSTPPRPDHRHQPRLPNPGNDKVRTHSRGFGPCRCPETSHGRPATQVC